MKKLLLCILGFSILLSNVAYAGKSYTPAQLRKMVNSGNPPKQGAITTQTKNLEFISCVTTAKSLIDAVKPQYPVKTIVDTKILFIVKTWTNDGAVTYNCSQPDRKVIVTIAKYI